MRGGVRDESPPASGAMPTSTTASRWPSFRMRQLARSGASGGAAQEIHRDVRRHDQRLRADMREQRRIGGHVGEREERRSGNRAARAADAARPARAAASPRPARSRRS